MSYIVGIDIGAVSMTAAVLGEPSGEAGPPLAGEGFVLAGEVDGRQLYLSTYRRTRGRPIEATSSLLDEVVVAVGAEAVTGLCLTGGAAALVAEKLSATTVNEFRAVALGLGAMGVPARTVFEMGGQTGKYLLLDREDGGYAIADYSTNGDCAAGTGSFIDQQAGRLHYAVEEIGGLASQVERTAQVAGRCSVFAKSDMIHAQQKGYSPAEVLAGLCHAVARNFRMAVVRSHPVEPPVAFIGGLAANEAVVGAMQEAFELGDEEFAVPEHYTHVPATGAAVAAARGQGRPSGDASRSRKNWSLGEAISSIRAASDSAHGTFPTARPLSMRNVLLLREAAESAELSFDGEAIDAYLGIDIGSVSTNLVLINTDGNVIKEIYTRTKGRPIEVVSAALKEIGAEVGDSVVIRGVGTTGSGRELVGRLVGADTINDEITAHKTGATWIGRQLLDGRIPDTIFEIGGQDSKYISLQDGVVVDFTMNEACAAGTGSFLEERAEELDISIINEFAELALGSKAPIRLGERCTVFMERDVNDYLQRGADKSDLVAGLAYSVVYNYINRVVRGRKVGECVFFQGGTAYNDSVAAAFAAVLGQEIIVPPHNGVMGAIGAALLAREMAQAGQTTGPARRVDELEGEYVGAAEEAEGEPVAAGAAASAQQRPEAVSGSRFRGYDLSQVDYSLREFTCKGCSNRCVIQEFTVEGEKTYWGDKCSDRFRKRSKADNPAVIEDLFDLREQLLEDESGLPTPGADALRIGIPRAMFGLDYLPFWRAFWRHLGFATIVSEPTNRQTVTAGIDHVVAEPCFPVIVAHGHVAALLAGESDYIFLPNIISAETPWMETESHLCPWGQTLPFVIRRVPAFEPQMHRLLTPRVAFRDGPAAVRKGLAPLCEELGVPGKLIRPALDAAYDAQRRFRETYLQAGREALATLQRTHQPGIVLIGRPYNVHDAGVNLSIARKLRDFYGVNCIPIDAMDLDDVDVRDINRNMYWSYGRKLIAAAKVVGENDHLHIIHISNFKCGPDSFIKHFIRTAGGKPFLSLQFDGHSNDAGVLTRCEAYLDSKGILRPWRTDKAAEDTAVLSS
jgi:predicted CoA-substrate-specific enzyme activase